MGDYYEVYANFDVDPNVSQEDKEILEAIERKDDDFLALVGKPRCWAWMFTFGAHYHARTEVCKIFKNDYAWSFIGKGDTRTYNLDDIEEFFDWLENVAEGFEGEFLGYYMHDQYKEEPVFMFRKTTSPEWRQ